MTGAMMSMSISHELRRRRGRVKEIYGKATFDTLQGVATLVGHTDTV